MDRTFFACAPKAAIAAFSLAIFACSSGKPNEPAKKTVSQVSVSVIGPCKLRSSGGYYVTAEMGGGGDVNANRLAAGPWETFGVVLLGPGSLTDGSHIQLRTDDSHYLSADQGGGGAFVANTYVATAWETFTIHRIAGPGAVHRGDAVAFETANGYFVGAEGGGGSTTYADRTAVGPWETWTFDGDGGGPISISFQSSGGNFMVAEGGGGREVRADRTSIGPWETFRVELVSGGFSDGQSVRLRADNNQYFRAQNAGGGWLNADSGVPGRWETFILHRLAGGGSFVTGDAVSIETSNGHFVVAEGGGGGVVNADRTSVGPWETWRLIVGGGVLPPAPTRDQVLAVRFQFQGMTVHTQQFGDLPWFEAAMAWLTPADRAAAYAVKHAAGDTHSIIAVPSGAPLYDEPNQPYSADRFGPLDWTNNRTRMDPQFVGLVVEQISNGFIPVIFMDERREYSYAMLPLVIDALQHGYSQDLTPYVLIMPGWDGVFYGWEPSRDLIPGWAALGRSTCPNCNLGIEFNTGHIPLGGGPGDYGPAGVMRDYDVLFVEFNDGNVHDNNTWQILSRLLGPQYHRPADDPNTPGPWYLAQPTVRGPYAVVCFEYNEYEWVRNRVSLAEIQARRQYLSSVGCPVVD